jgi:hypothetical protein
MVRRETPPELARVTEEGGALAGLYGENSMLDCTQHPVQQRRYWLTQGMPSYSCRATLCTTTHPRATTSTSQTESRSGFSTAWHTRSRAVGPEAVAYGDDDERDKTAALDDLLVQSGVAGKSRRKSVADLRPVDLAGVSGVGVDRIAGSVNCTCVTRPPAHTSTRTHGQTNTTTDRKP